jgi:DNA replication and repair protein RecF
LPLSGIHSRVAAPTKAASLAVRRLRLTDFRCYRECRIETDDRPVVLTGPNGAGKTNLLEALSFLAPGRGLRRAALVDVGRRTPVGGARPWAVAAVIARGTDAVEIGTGIAPAPATDPAGARRVVKIDGVETRTQDELGRHVVACWLTPEMDRLFQEGASVRRRFLDRMVYGFDAGHAARLADYERCMRERLRLLRDGDGSATQDAWLGALEGRTAELGVAIAAARREVAARLAAACAASFGPFPAARVQLDGTLEGWLATDPALAAEDRFRARLADCRRIDAEAGRPTVGPHRSDLAVYHVAKDAPARLCSTGEQKALLVRIVLASARLQTVERGMAPLLLLDELAAHLDAERRSALFDELSALGAQAWVTGTDAADFAAFGTRAQWFRVDDACVTVQ